MSRILIIDDDKQMREMLKQTLERAGYAVIEAQNGLEGVAVYREQHVDVVITDLIMPGKDGMETIIELKREFPDVRIIAVSGGSRAWTRWTICSTLRSLAFVTHSPSPSTRRTSSTP